MVEAIIKPHKLEDVTHAIVRSARTGEIRDGKIFVESATRIRTGENGGRAV
jgi:nitrogen regulatory protein P-II 1